MLKRASVAEVRNETVTKADGLVVVAMRVYPRFLARALVSEYSPRLAPAADLFARYRDLKRTYKDQNRAFLEAGYPQRFDLDDAAIGELGRLAKRAGEQDVFLICQCDRDEMCHVDLMLLMAEHRFAAKIGPLSDEYPVFRKRLLATSPH